MKLILLGLLVTASSFAFTVNTQIVDIEDNGDEKSLDVLATYNGRIFKVNRENYELIDRLAVARDSGAEVELDLNGTTFGLNVLNKIEEVTDVTLLTTGELIENMNITNKPTPMDNYTPTDLGTMEKAKKVFSSLRSVGKTKKRSECFNRAYIWAKHMSDYYRINSMKILIYYSKKYRENIKNSKWWFHIAPMVKVGDKYIAMDRQFLSKPVTALEWENFFTKQIPNKRYNCKHFVHYSEFTKNYRNYNEWCFIQYTSMYYWEPNDMERLEKTGQQQTRWKDSRIKAAAKQAFKRWTSVYDRYKL
ncbi:MAG: protein-glutamine glutaminase family protein [Bacteriovoracaceae bacterium]|jgi:hypothetical protein|nr:protein-glutamine glutaminase family protein [Bacteriovoracaceae bacterium]